MLTLPRVKKCGRVLQINEGHPNQSQNWGVNGGSYGKVHSWLEYGYSRCCGAL